MRPIYLLVLILISTLAFADIEQYAQIVELSDQTSSHTIQLVYDSNNFTLQLPVRIEDLELQIDNTNVNCPLIANEGFTLLNCGMYPGKHTLFIKFNTFYPIIKLGQQVMYKSDVTPTQTTHAFSYIVKLPEGSIIPKDKDVNFFISPSQDQIYSDGRRVIISWKKMELTGPFDVSVIYQTIITSSKWPWYLVIALFGIIIFLIFRKKKANIPALIAQEKKIVQLLSESPEKNMWQKQLHIASGLSKVKLSRLLRNLEKRGVIRKEQYGNTNKIHLIED